VDDSAGAKRMILLAVVVTGIITIIADLSEGQRPSIRVGVGVVFAAVLLSVIAEFAPKLARSFAALMVLSAVFLRGAPVFTAITGVTQKGTTTK
jgi:hypothetical protein